MSAVPTQAVALRDHGRSSVLGLSGRVTIGIGVVLAVYLISAPLLMLLTAAMRGPQDLLPFEPGAQWTLANLSVYQEAGLWKTVIPNTLIFAEIGRAHV